MRNILSLFALIFFGDFDANAQNEKNQPPPPKVSITKFKPPVLNEQGKQFNEFMKRNPTIANIEWKDSVNAIVKFKNKKIENYNLGIDADKKAFIDKYGVPPMPPPPPPKQIVVNVPKEPIL